MKYLISVFCIFLFSGLPAQKTGIINDPDGYTNIRSGKGTNHGVVDKIKEGEKFHYIPSSESNWWAVETIPYSGEPVHGYVHKSRIQPYYPESSPHCNCHEEYKYQNTKPVMSPQVGPINLAICGPLLQRHSVNSIKIVEFSITNCETDKVVRSYSALQPCNVVQNNNSVEITELIRLPIGKGFQWIQTPYRTVEITEVSDELTFGDEQFVLDLSSISDSDIDAFVSELPRYKGKGHFDKEETFVGKLLVCTLKGDKQCEAVFNNINGFLDASLDGASAEMYNICLKVLENSTHGRK